MAFKIGDVIILKNVTEDNTGIDSYILEELKKEKHKITDIDIAGEYMIEDGWWFKSNQVELLEKGEDSMKKVRGFEEVRKEMRKTEGAIILPTRGSKTSAGYDFYSTESFTLKPNEKKLIWSDVKAYMQEGEVLELYVRSSIGIKKSLMLKNLTGIIDSDYYENESNDGNIGICLYNYGNEEVTIEKGERIAQGIFKQFLVADNGNTDKERNGGFGSTGTK